jgi:hypothetical protein
MTANIEEDEWSYAKEALNKWCRWSGLPAYDSVREMVASLWKACTSSVMHTCMGH